MAPPIPGPVFSPAFKALLVLMAGGSLYLAYTLYWQCKKIHEGGIGEDNVMLTAAEPGSADWLRNIQISRSTAWSKWPAWQWPSSPPVRSQGAPDGPVQLGTPRVRPGHWDPSHSLSCSGEPPYPPKDARRFHRLSPSR